MLRANTCVQLGLEGYVEAGEYRIPREGELYRLGDRRPGVMRSGGDVKTPQAIMVKIPKIPSGYEFTGEYRRALPGETYVIFTGAKFTRLPGRPSISRKFILKKAAPMSVASLNLRLTGNASGLQKLKVDTKVEVIRAETTFRVLGRLLTEAEGYALLDSLEHALNEGDL